MFRLSVVREQGGKFESTDLEHFRYGQSMRLFFPPPQLLGSFTLSRPSTPTLARLERSENTLGEPLGQLQIRIQSKFNFRDNTQVYLLYSK